MYKYSNLNLGWEIGDDFHPIIKKTKGGELSKSNLSGVDPSLIAQHTAIIAQSGSGKSFFLGRLIEEILVKTKCFCTILDPNADFKKCYELVGQDTWENPTYSYEKALGKLPTEKSKNSFESKWDKITKKVFSSNTNVANQFVDKIEVWWQTINIDLISSGMKEFERTQLYQCHKLTEVMEYLYFNNIVKEKDDISYIDDAKKILNKSKDISPVDFLLFLDRKLNRSFAKDSYHHARNYYTNKYFNYNVNDFKLLLSDLCEHINLEMFEFYYSVYMKLRHNDLLIDDFLKFNLNRQEHERLRIYDLPSIDEKNLRLLLMSCILNNEFYRVKKHWEEALTLSEEEDKRVPKFIVIDEAHNLIPRDSNNMSEMALRDQIRTIAAEGRKFGLFLIIVSQRPDKIDQKVLSECSNYIFMKINNKNIINELMATFNIEEKDRDIIESCLRFPKGRYVLGGAWADINMKKAYTAMRRSYEGGRNLNKDFWSKP